MSQSGIDVVVFRLNLLKAKIQLTYHPVIVPITDPRSLSIFLVETVLFGYQCIQILPKHTSARERPPGGPALPNKRPAVRLNLF